MGVRLSFEIVIKLLLLCVWAGGEDRLINELLHGVGQIKGCLGQFLQAPVQGAFPAAVALGAPAERALQVDRLAHGRQGILEVLLGRALLAPALDTDDA